MIIFFITTILFIFLYAYAQSYRIDPVDCPNGAAAFGLIPNQSAETLFTCDSNGFLGTNECRFQADSLQGALEICNSNPNTCRAFTWENNEVLFKNYPGGVGESILYIRNLN